MKAHPCGYFIDREREGVGYVLNRVGIGKERDEQRS